MVLIQRGKTINNNSVYECIIYLIYKCVFLLRVFLYMCSLTKRRSLQSNFFARKKTSISKIQGAFISCYLPLAILLSFVLLHILCLHIISLV